MAGHKVICKLCGKTFDRDKEPALEVSPRRYAHQLCYDRMKATEEQDKEDLLKLENYIKGLFGIEELSKKILNQITKYTMEDGMTYGQILLCLQYHYEIRHGDIEKAHGAIGIVPYVRDAALNYYISLMKARERTTYSMMKVEETPIREIKIKVPKRQPMCEFNSFSFLDEE